MALNENEWPMSHRYLYGEEMPVGTVVGFDTKPGRVLCRKFNGDGFTHYDLPFYPLLTPMGPEPKAPRRVNRWARLPVIIDVVLSVAAVAGFLYLLGAFDALL